MLDRPEGSVVIDGQTCSWHQHRLLGIVVKREPWSLIGTGKTLVAAIDDFRRECWELARIMQYDNPNYLRHGRARILRSRRHLLHEPGQPC